MKKIFLCLLVFSIAFLGITHVNAEEQVTLRVLVIEINPILKTIENTDLYGNNGHPYVSEYFNQDRNIDLNEMKEDIEQMSHGYVKIEFVKFEYLDEFPTYTSYISLMDGTAANRYDEETYITMARSSRYRDVGDWYSFMYDTRNKPVDYTFDYGYIINKFDLVNRKNNDEFDQVWLNTIDPAATFETMMVGRNAYWINGNPINYDCDNFMIANLSISRRDANLHAYGHSSEFILNNVFNRDNWAYGKTYYDDTIDNYNQLNLWQKFSMPDIESTGENAGVGNVHYPYNGRNDYDYTNSNYTYTYWRNWLNYPDLSGEKVLDNYNAWMDFEVNKALDDTEEKDPDRLYMRFWYYLMPHIEGRTADGFYNNWWKYIISMDYVTEIEQNEKDNTINVNIGSEVKLDCNLKYVSGKTVNLSEISLDNNIHISGDTLEFENGKLVAKKIGNSILTICYDGVCVDYNVVTKKASLFNITTIIVIIIVLAVIGGIIFFIRKKPKKDKKKDNVVVPPKEETPSDKPVEEHVESTKPVEDAVESTKPEVHITPPPNGYPDESSDNKIPDFPQIDMSSNNHKEDKK